MFTASGFDFYAWVVIPALIFTARLADVSLATMRHILVGKGMKKVVPFLGFFEVLIWLLAITQVMQNLHNAACYLAWAAGFSAGTYVGMVLEEKLALGYQLIRIVSNQQNDNLSDALKKAGHGITVLSGQGAYGPVKVIFTTVKRKEVKAVLDMIVKINPQSFYTIEDIRHAGSGVFSAESGKSVLGNLFALRKGK